MISIVSEHDLAIPAEIEDAINEDDDDEDDDKVNLKVMQEESSKGKVKGSLFLRYISAGTNYFIVFILMLLFVLTQLSASGVDYWVNYYVNVEDFLAGNYSEIDLANKPIPYRWSTDVRLIVYSSGIVGLFIVAMMRSVLFYKIAMWSSQRLHHMTFDNVIATPMRFFDTNPSGRILNRFSKDLGAVDEALPKVMLDAAQVRYTFQKRNVNRK